MNLEINIVHIQITFKVIASPKNICSAHPLNTLNCEAFMRSSARAHPPALSDTLPEKSLLYPSTLAPPQPPPFPRLSFI